MNSQAIRDALNVLVEAWGDEFADLPPFAVMYVSALLGGCPSKHKTHHDLVLPNGLRLEVKYSRACTNNDPSRRGYRSFWWKGLKGYQNSKDGNVDYVVLSGRDDGQWMFWVIPYDKIKYSGQSVMWKLGPIKYPREWLQPFYVGGEDGLIARFAA